MIRNWVPQTRGSGVGERLPANGVGVRKRRAGRGTAQRLGARTGGERSHWLQNRFRTQPAASICAQISPLRKTSPKTGFSQQQPGRREQRLSPLRGVCASSGRGAGSVLAGLGHGGWEGRAVPAPVSTPRRAPQPANTEQDRHPPNTRARDPVRSHRRQRRRRPTRVLSPMSRELLGNRATARPPGNCGQQEETRAHTRSPRNTPRAFAKGAVH